MISSGPSSPPPSRRRGLGVGQLSRANRPLPLAAVGVLAGIGSLWLLWPTAPQEVRIGIAAPEVRTGIAAPVVPQTPVSQAAQPTGREVRVAIGLAAVPQPAAPATSSPTMSAGAALPIRVEPTGVAAGRPTREPAPVDRREPVQQPVVVAIVPVRPIPPAPPPTPMGLTDWSARPLPQPDVIGLADLAIVRSLTEARSHALADAGRVAEPREVAVLRPALSARESAFADQLLTLWRADSLAIAAPAVDGLLTIPDAPVAAIPALSAAATPDPLLADPVGAADHTTGLAVAALDPATSARLEAPPRPTLSDLAALPSRSVERLGLRLVPTSQGIAGRSLPSAETLRVRPPSTPQRIATLPDRSTETVSPRPLPTAQGLAAIPVLSADLLALVEAADPQSLAALPPEIVERLYALAPSALMDVVEQVSPPSPDAITTALRGPLTLAETPLPATAWLSAEATAATLGWAVARPTPEAATLDAGSGLYASAFDPSLAADGAGEARGLAALPPRTPPLQLAAPAPDHGSEPLFVPRPRPVRLASVDSVDDLRRLLSARDVDIRPGAVLPDLFLHRLPSDITAIRQAEERKAVFMRTLLPLVIKVNERWLALRTRVEALAPLMAIGAPLHPEDEAEVEGLLREARLDRWNEAELLRRLDAIPPSLALAQAAEESGWGTSNAARNLNALFGEMVARGPDAGQIRRFEDLSSTVAAYVRNLNTHAAYADMRRRRAQLRQAGLPIDGASLIQHMLRYSERGPDYVAAIQTLIRMNNLTQYDDARLTDANLVAEAR